MGLERIEPGTPVVAAPWNEGRLPAPELVLHRWSHRDEMGLGVTVCGLRQEDRGNSWTLLTNTIDPERWPMSSMCPECEAWAW